MPAPLSFFALWLKLQPVDTILGVIRKATGLNELNVRSIRGAIEESLHHVSIALVEVNGSGAETRRETFGRPWPQVSLRSAAKPFQALQLFEAAVDRYHISAEEIALACSSHNSEQDQVDRVAALLQRIGRTEDDLACGPHRSLIKDAGIVLSDPHPPDPPIAPPSRLASNCSGKHTGMLAVALTSDVPTEGYHQIGHPVQQGVGRILERASDIPADKLVSGVDGCGVVCWAMPLEAMALAYARLGAGGEPERAVVAAMMAHPQYVAGARRTCTALMRAFPGEVVAKFGACGAYGVSFPDRRLGLALKINDGNGPAATAALLEAIDQLQLLPNVKEALPDYVEPRILNTRREVVGKYQAFGRLR